MKADRHFNLEAKRTPVQRAMRAGLVMALAGVIVFCIYLFLPTRTNILILGLDAREGEDNLARSDTMILFTVTPLQPTVGMMSIPRDLWISIPDVGEDRINAVHFYAEAALPGSGPQATKQVVGQQFGIPVDYYLRIRFDGLAGMIDSLGGLRLTFDQPTSGYPVGTHLLDGAQALAFVRDRAGSDDFARMSRGQFFIKALWSQLLNPDSWPRFPAVAAAVVRMVDLDIPFVLWPRLGLAFARVGPNGVETQVLGREMVVPFTTAAGAQVLRPEWEMIHPVVAEMFGK